MKVIGILLGAAMIAMQARGQEALTIGIQATGPDTVNVTVSGGPGLHSIRKKADLAAQDTTN